MKYRKFANTDIDVSEVGLGTMSLSGCYPDGKYNYDECIEVLNQSLELGINFWDTANIYTNGVYHSEEIVSKVLVPNREKVFICTKVGLVMNPGCTNAYDAGTHHIDGHPDVLKKEVDASLKRLGVDTVDLMYLHRVDPDVPVEESIGALAELVQAGKIKYLGLSEVPVEDIIRAETVHPIAAVQSWYSMILRSIENDVLPYMEEKKKCLVAFRCLDKGMLMEDTERNRKLKEFASGKGISLSQLAFAWTLAQGKSLVTIMGTKSVKNLRDNAAACDVVLTREELKEIDEIVKDDIDYVPFWVKYGK